MLLKLVFQYLLVLCKTSTSRSLLRLVDKGILPLEKNSVAIQFYIDIENQAKIDACVLRSKPRRCCLTDNKDTDCDTMDTYGYYYNILKPKYRDTILFIYPTIIQHDLVGYCNFLVEHRCGQNIRKRSVIKIPFDTRLAQKSHYLRNYLNGEIRVSTCDTLDQDSLNQCAPVNCAMKYSGMKPFYNIDLEACTKAAECLSDMCQELPGVVYNPKSNTCRDLDNPLSLGDIYTINAGLSIVTQNPTPNEVRMMFESNCTTISQNLMYLKDLLFNKFLPEKCVKYQEDIDASAKKAAMMIMFIIFIISLALLFFVLLVHILEIMFKRWKSGELRRDINNIKKRFHRSDSHSDVCNLVGRKLSRNNSKVKARLLKDVIVSGLPLELRPDASAMYDVVATDLKRNLTPVGDGPPCEKTMTSHPHTRRQQRTLK